MHIIMFRKTRGTVDLPDMSMKYFSMIGALAPSKLVDTLSFDKGTTVGDK